MTITRSWVAGPQMLFCRKIKRSLRPRQLFCWQYHNRMAGLMNTSKTGHDELVAKYMVLLRAGSGIPLRIRKPPDGGGQTSLRNNERRCGVSPEYTNKNYHGDQWVNGEW